MIEDWSRHMERHHTATAGSAAVDEEMELSVDPAYAVEVDRISESRAAGSRGSQPEESCDKGPPNTMVRNSPKQDGSSPMPHAASSCRSRKDVTLRGLELTNKVEYTTAFFFGWQ